MTDRKTLGLKDTSDAEAPDLPKKGRGWKISDKRLDALHDRAREMRRFASPANKALAKKFAEADLGRYTFKRFAVVGSAIVDFNCHNLGMAIMIDEEDQDETLAKRRDKSLESVGSDRQRLCQGCAQRAADGVCCGSAEAAGHFVGRIGRMNHLTQTTAVTPAKAGVQSGKALRLVALDPSFRWDDNMESAR